MAGKNNSDSPKLEVIYYNFARSILSALRKQAKSRGIPQRSPLGVVFDESTWKREQETKNDYLALESQCVSLLWASDEVRQCVRLHWDQKVIHRPSHYPPVSSIEQILPSAFQELLSPLMDTIEHYDTLRPTRKQILDSYHQYREAWSSPNIRFNITVPLLNFTSELGQQVAISQNLQLAPFPPDEKYLIWNAYSTLYPVVIHSIEVNAFAQTQFKLAGINLNKQNQPNWEHQLSLNVRRHVLSGCHQ